MRCWLLALIVPTLIVGTVPAADPPASEKSAEKSAEKNAEKSFQVPYRLTDTKHVLVRVKINGKGPFNLILDTGAPAVFIPKKVATKAGLETDRNGWSKVNRFELEGGLVVDDTKCRIADLFQLEGMNGMGLAGVELHGVIGYNVLAKYRITYDFAADKLVWVPLDFEPPSVNAMGKSNSQGGLDLLGPMMKMMAGFMGIKPNFEVQPRGFLGFEIEDQNDEVIVKSVLKGSAAGQAGLKVGDQIVAVAVPNPMKRGKASFEDIDRVKDLTRLLANIKPGDEAKIRVKRGKETPELAITIGRGL